MSKPPLTDVQIEALKAVDDFEGLGQAVDSLMHLPQSLCKMRGHCCKVATFKGSMSVEELKATAAGDSVDAGNAQDFLTLFIPYESQDAVRAVAPEFVERVRGEADTADKDNIAFFHCRFVGDKGQCMVHEDRPTGCRMYPFPHSKTVYHPGCGFEQQGKANWNKIQEIMTFFDTRLKALQSEAQQIESVLAPEDPPAPETH